MAERGDVIIGDGNIKFGMEYRDLLSDQGLCIHALGDVDGEEVELLRFDCFDHAPHYHYGPAKRNERLMLDQTTEGNPLDWTISQLRNQLPEMVRRAGYEELADSIDTDAPPRGVLGLAGRHLLGFITSTFGQQMFRLCVAECDRFPELGQRFYNSGPAVVRREMAGYFETAVARGQLRMEDPLLAADQFGELCKGDVWLRLTFGIIDRISQAEIDRVVDSAVDMFLARYAA